MISRLLRYSALVVLAFGFIVAAGLTWLWCLAQESPATLERKGVLASHTLLNSYPLHDSRVSEIRLTSTSGLIVDIAVREPADWLEHRPLLFMMGGQETGRAAVNVIPDTRGVLLAAISYPFGTVPHRDMAELLLALPGIQSGIFDTPAAALLALDFLLGPASGYAPGQVELAGVSFGAYLAPVPAALDSRIQRLWLIHGGAAPAEALSYLLRKRVANRWLREAMADYFATVIGAPHLGPEAWVPGLAPRPLVLVHAREDSALPQSAKIALERLAGPPAEILWTRGNHVHPKRPDVVAEISDLLFQRVGRPIDHPNGHSTGQNGP